MKGKKEEYEAGKEREKRKTNLESGLWEFFKSTFIPPQASPFRDFDQVDGDYRY